MSKRFLAVSVLLCCISSTSRAAGAGSSDHAELGSTSEAASYAELVEKAKASQKLAAEAGARPIQPAEDPETFLHAYGYNEVGGVQFYPDMGEVLLDQRPTNADVLRRPWVMVAPGETASLLVGAWAVRAAEKVEMHARVLDGKGKPADVKVTVRPVVFAPVAERGQKVYRMQGLWLADPGPISVDADRAVAWLLEIAPGAKATAGEYRLDWRIDWQNEDPKQAPQDNLRLTILPVKLADPFEQDYTFGVFCAGADFSEVQFRQMADHGLDAILWFWGHYGLSVQNKDGKLVMDFATLDATMAKLQAGGMRGPVVLGLGNDSAGHFERRICEAFDLPMQPRVERDRKVVKLATLDEPRTEELMIEALSQLFEHANRKGWPEIVIMPYDEPTERLMEEHKRMVGLFREHFPKVRLYGCTMNRLSWAKQLLDTDILVSNGDFARIVPLAREHGKTSWLYGGTTAALGFGHCRSRYGLDRYVFKPDGSWFWSYNFYPGEPWNEFDANVPDSAWVIAWPPLTKGGPAVGTLGFAGIRAAVDDVRYALALEKVLDGGKGPHIERIRKQYQAWREQAAQQRLKASDAAAARVQLVEWLLEATDKPLPAGLKGAKAPASQPAPEQEKGFQEVENEQA